MTMTSLEVSPTKQSKAMTWTGRVLSGLIAAFMLLDAVMKLILPEPVRKATQEFGFPVESIRPMGIVCLMSVLLYAIPRTAVLGAILLTGYFGGAVATHVWKGDGQWFFAVIFGVVTWIGLYLRDPRIRALTPVAE